MTRILFLTDLHGARGYLSALLERENDVDLVLLGGDITSFGGAEQAAAMINPLMSAYPAVRSVHGNVDLPGVLQWLESGGLSLHGRGEVLEELGIFGCGGSNPTPMRTPTEYPEPTIAELMEAGLASVADAKIKVLVSHTPPFNTTVDRMFAGKNVGSTAVRDFLQNHPVDVCLCGHIHEAEGIERVGGAMVVNPGAFCSGRYAIIEVDGGQCRGELRQVQLGRRQRIHATVTGIAAKVVGYTRHRLGG